MPQLKKRCWSVIAYPESMPDEWETALHQSGLACAISMLHDRDVYPPGHKLEGQTKKPHYHILLLWDGPTTYKNASNVSQEFLGTKAVKMCLKPSNAIDYWTHDEESNKASYTDCEDQIRYLNKFDPSDLGDLMKEEERNLVTRIKFLIREKEVVYYWEMDEILEKLQYTEPELWDYFRSHSIYFDKLLYSRAKGKFNETYKTAKYTDKDNFGDVNAGQR